MLVSHKHGFRIKIVIIFFIYLPHRRNFKKSDRYIFATLFSEEALSINTESLNYWVPGCTYMYLHILTNDEPNKIGNLNNIIIEWFLFRWSSRPRVTQPPWNRIRDNAISRWCLELGLNHSSDRGRGRGRDPPPLSSPKSSPTQQGVRDVVVKQVEWL